MLQNDTLDFKERAKKKKNKKKQYPKKQNNIILSLKEIQISFRAIYEEV